MASQHLDQFKKHDQDTGSSEVQIIQLTERISNLSQHLKTHRKDFHCMRGLRVLISSRKRLLAYLKRKNKDVHEKVVQALGLRHG